MTPWRHQFTHDLLPTFSCSFLDTSHAHTLQHTLLHSLIVFLAAHLIVREFSVHDMVPQDAEQKLLRKQTMILERNLHLQSFELASEVPNGFLLLFQLTSQIVHTNRSTCTSNQWEFCRWQSILLLPERTKLRTQFIAIAKLFSFFVMRFVPFLSHFKRAKSSSVKGLQRLVARSFCWSVLEVNLYLEFLLMPCFHLFCSCQRCITYKTHHIIAE